MKARTLLRITLVLVLVASLPGCGGLRRSVDSIGKWSAEPVSQSYGDETNLLVLLEHASPTQKEVAANDDRRSGQKVEDLLAYWESSKDDAAYVAKRRILLEAFRRRSNQLCQEYKLDLIRKQARGNFLLGTASLLFGTAGAVVSHVDTARALSGAAAFSTGSRSEINQDYFFEKTAAVIAKAIDKRREIQWRLIEANRDVSRRAYSLRGALIDIEEYHATCSISGALFELERAVDSINVLQSVEAAASAASAYEQVRAKITRDATGNQPQKK